MHIYDEIESGPCWVLRFRSDLKTDFQEEMPAIHKRNDKLIILFILSTLQSTLDSTHCLCKSIFTRHAVLKTVVGDKMLNDFHKRKNRIKSGFSISSQKSSVITLSNLLIFPQPGECRGVFPSEIGRRRLVSKVAFFQNCIILLLSRCYYHA